MDDIDEIFLDIAAAPVARVGGRFRPKAKPRPSKVASKEDASVLPSAIVEKPVTLSTTVSDNVPFVESVDVGDDKLTNPFSPSLATSEILGSKEPSKSNESSCANVQLSNGDKVTEPGESSATASLQLDVAESPSSCANVQLSNGDKVKEPGESSATASLQPDVTESLQPEVAAAHGKTAGENTDSFSELECLDDGLSSTTTVTVESIDLEQRISKFQPKLKVKKGKENLHVARPEVECTTLSEAAHLVPFVTCEMNKCPQTGDVFDQPFSRLGESSTPNIASDSQLNRENFAEATASDGTILGDSVHSEDVGGTSGKGRIIKKRKTSTASNPPQKSKSSAASKEAEGGKSSRPMRKRLPRQQDDELVREVNEDSIAAAPSGDPNVNEDENGDDEYREHKTSRKKIAPKKSKKTVSEEEPVRKRKMAKKVPDQLTKDPPRKFSHSTRRNRRHVDKSLLQIPEDELDPQKLTIKDLIRIAEHKEQLEIKEARKLRTPVPDQSATANHDSQKEALHNEEETLASEHDVNSNADQESFKVAASTFVLNYQSYMDKAPSARWSKQDTELFYEAMQQCGSDFRMIQELYFPGRTRHQVMLKFKKEERQHPSRIDGVLQGKMKISTENCVLTKYIEKLQQAAQERESNADADADEAVDMTGKEEEDTEGVQKLESEEVEDAETSVVEEDKEAEVNNRLNPDDFDEEDFTWDE